MRLIRPSFTSPVCVAVIAAVSIFNAACVEAQESKPSIVASRSLTAPVKRVVTLDPLPNEEASVPSMVELNKTLQKTPENFRQFAAVGKGQVGDTQTLTLRFAAGAKLMTIKSTPDFKVEQGGSCVEGYSYPANGTCALLVRSTPQGPGRRLGKLEITNSAEVMPLYVGLGGYGYSPTISFTPSVITTVPGTYVSGAGTISGATNLAIDGGDSLYIADTGNNEIKTMNSSGTFASVTQSSLTAPVAVAVDSSGYVYFTESGQSNLLIAASTYILDSYGGGSTSECAVGSTCPLFNADVDFSSAGAFAVDPNGTIFINYYYGQALRLSNTASGLEYTPLLTPDNNNDNAAYEELPRSLAVDGSDTLYTYYASGGNEQCIITGESYYNAETGTYQPVVVAGTQTACGFSGDGGQARGAEVGKEVGQMTFDIAGNLYFTDTLNQRVRRIDNATGIITTIAGNGAIGYYGDGGPATAAALNTPLGLTVDSQGQVYILSNATTTGTAQVVRKVGVVGALNLGNMTVGSPSTAQTVTLANTGNSNLDFTHVGFSSGNTADFVIDPNTTSCNFTVALPSGRSCKIGFIFTPSATGNRAAVLSITDDTLAGINTIQLTGEGYTTATLTPTSFSFASTNVGSSSVVQVATLTNTGKALMTISGIGFSGTGATSYSDTTTCGTTLAVGASCTVSVTFKPAAVGSLPATLTVFDNAITTRQMVTVTGTGVGVAKPVLAPTSLAFTSTTVGATSAAKTITLSNTGTAALTVTSITMTGTNAADFSLTKTCGTSVAIGGSCTISVSFKPTAAGTRTGSVSVVSSAGTLTAAVTDVEADALREGQVGAVVDGVGGAAHVLLPGVGAGFAAAAGLFSPPKAPPISAPEVPMLTLAMPQSEPRGGEEELGLAQVDGEDGGGEALGTSLLRAMASSKSRYLRT
jgi:sugar lactone lactonase YvrE